MIKFTLCPTNLIPNLWDSISPCLSKPVELSHGECTMETLYNDLVEAKQGLIIVTDEEEIIACITTQVRTFDTGLKALYMPMVGGARMDEWLDEALSILTEIAKNYGATELRGYMVRKGWDRVLMGEKGWKPVYNVLSYTIGDDK